LTRSEKIEKFDIFRGNFPNPNHKWLTRPDLAQATKIDPTQPGSKKFVQDPSLLANAALLILKQTEVEKFFSLPREILVISSVRRLDHVGPLNVKFTL